MPIYHIGNLLFPSQPTPPANHNTNPVLFRLKQNVTSAQLTTWSQTAQNMVGQIPGLRSLKANTPLPICVPRAKGFNMGLVAVLEEAKDVEVYAAHPAHQEYFPTLSFSSSIVICLSLSFTVPLCGGLLLVVGLMYADCWSGRVQRMREELCEETLAYDLEFEE